MRNDSVTDWLTKSEWANWHRQAMTGDASARRYERLTSSKGHHVILMDAPPEQCGSQARFVEIASHLRNMGLAAPDIFAWDDTLGLMVLEDLGDTDFAGHLSGTPQDEHLLYHGAVDVLQRIDQNPAPQGLVAMTPDVGAEMITLAFEWAARDQSPDLASNIKAELNALLATVSPSPKTLSLRDFHAENLIWRPESAGTHRVGLLDFQDAFVAHPAYDLASLLRDARRDVDPDLLTTLLARLGHLDDMRPAFHILAVQRNLRILGIFERLAQQDGKTAYRALVPRVRAHLVNDLQAPELAQLAPLVTRAFDLYEGAAV